VLQLQAKEPAVLEHVASVWQLFKASIKHSSISLQAVPEPE
jgi:hypothetical protein